MTQPKKLHPTHAAITVVKNNMGMPYEDFIKEPFLSQVVYKYIQEDAKTFVQKKEFLTSMGLVTGNPYANPRPFTDEDLKDPGRAKSILTALENILVYEDPRVAGECKGAWRVRCDLNNPAKNDYQSSFMFRTWERGSPQVLGLDVRSGALRKFYESFKPNAIFELGSNYQVEIDWDTFEKLSPFPIKRF